MRILIADDHDLVREMIADVLEREAECTVAHAASIDAVIEVLKQSEPFDLIFLDYQMPGMNELAGMRLVMRTAPDTPVALLSGVANKTVAQRAIDGGAKGFVPKTMKARSLVNAIKFMVAGEVFLPVNFMTGADQAPESATALGLTKRELEVLAGLCEGMSNKEIGLRLDLQEVTVKLHVKTLTRKMNAKNRTHAAMLARDMALLAG